MAVLSPRYIPHGIAPEVYTLAVQSSYKLYSAFIASVELYLRENPIAMSHKLVYLP